ncbi:hypothetical protein LIER_42623 [Lithospermum erythrorhizon]|uniref:Uncharacterized protein n=1 Tax=Lithospermum erythrorhizon TaxID=34254 RepID=A0AAV3NMJ2_LITER
MDNMERGPFPLNAQPVSAVKMLPQMKPHCPVSNSSDFNSNDDDDDSDDNDVRKNKSKSINNILRGGTGVVYSSNNDAGGNSSVYGRNMRIPIVGGSERGMMPKVMMNSKKRRGYDEDSDDDEEDEEVDVDGEGDDDVGDGDGGNELALEIKGFAERFMRVEKMKLEMMRETERYRMDMEKKRMDMIMNSQRKIVDTIGRAFRAHKKLNTGDEV